MNKTLNKMSKEAEKTVFYIGEIDAKFLETVINIALDPDKNKVNLFITSPGGVTGVVTAARPWINMIKNRVNIVNMDEVGSIAFSIFMLFSNRFSFPDATFVSHQTRLSFDPGRAVPISEVLKEHKTALLEDNKLGKKEKRFLTKQEIKDYDEGKDILLTATEALKRGIIEGIIK